MNLNKSKRRVADHGEVFTPPWLVDKMLDLVKGETERIDFNHECPFPGYGPGCVDFVSEHENGK